MLDKVIKVFGNVATGPKATIAGLILSCFAGYMIYHTEGDLDYASVEVVLFLMGVYFFLSGDGILGFKTKKKEVCDCDDELCEK